MSLFYLVFPFLSLPPHSLPPPLPLFLSSNLHLISALSFSLPPPIPQLTLTVHYEEEGNEISTTRGRGEKRGRIKVFTMQHAGEGEEEEEDEEEEKRATFIKQPGENV